MTSTSLVHQVLLDIKTRTICFHFPYTICTMLLSVSSLCCNGILCRSARVTSATVELPFRQIHHIGVLAASVSVHISEDAGIQALQAECFSFRCLSHRVVDTLLHTSVPIVDCSICLSAVLTPAGKRMSAAIWMKSQCHNQMIVK